MRSILIATFLFSFLISTAQEKKNSTKENDTIKNLKEVTISSKIGVTQIEPQKIRFSTDDLSSQRGGTAGDILKNMLSVAMGGSPNHNRDIRYRGLGNGYTTVLINGKPSGITGNNRETVLDMLPAGQIDYIEIISNPSADQTANGMNGIVNIVLKKGSAGNKQNGQISFYSDNQKGSNGNIALQYGTEKWNISGSFDKLKRSANKFDNGKQTKLNTDGSVKELVNIKKAEIKSFDNTNASARLQYNVNQNLSITGEYLFGEQTESKTKEEFNITNLATNAFKSGKYNNEKEDKFLKFYNPSLSITQKFNKSTFEFNINANFSQENKDKSALAYTTKDASTVDYTKLPTQQKENEKIEFKNYFPAFAFKTKVAENISLKTGVQGFITNRLANKEVQKLNNTTNVWAIAPNNTNGFKAGEQTFASYITSDINLDRFKIVLGFRHEYTHIETESKNTTTISKKSDYQIPLPNFSLTYSLTDQSYLKSSIGRRIRRPGFNDLNPTIEIKSITEIKVGNPNLQPEKAWAYEFGYFGESNKINYGVNVFHRDIDGLIQKNLTTDENGITTESIANLNRAISSGVEFLVGVQPVKWYNLNVNYSRFWSEIKDKSGFDGEAIKDQTDYTFKAINDFTINSGFNIQFITNIVGPKNTSQETEKTIWYADLGLDKQIFKNGFFTVRVSDVFDTLKKQKVKNTIVQIENTTENTPGRIMTAGVRWQF